MLEQISHCQAHNMRFVLYNLMISGGTASQQTFIFPLRLFFISAELVFYRVCCLFLSMLDLEDFSQQQLSVINEDICLKQELSPMMTFKIQREK